MEKRYDDAYRSAYDARLHELKSAPGFMAKRIGLGVVGGLVGGAVGAILHAPLVAVVLAVAGAGAGAGLLLHYGLTMAAARKAGRDARSNLWGADRGLSYLDEIEPRDTVAFLRDRDDPTAENCFSGPMAGGHGLLYNFTYETTSTDGQGHTTTHYHHFTVLEVERQLPISRISVSRRATSLLHGWTDKLSSTFTRDRAIQLESVEFDDEYHLEVADEADDLAVRRLFTPKVIAQFIDDKVPHPNFQYEHGTFVCWKDDHFDIDQLEQVDAFLASASPVIELLGEAADELRDGLG